MKLFAALRAVVYASGFVLLWGWLALKSRVWDVSLGGALPGWTPPIGAALMLAGATLALTCIGAFAALGRGTPAPFDPPRIFVARGPYRFVRNPMYVGALTLLAGFGLVVRSPGALALVPIGMLIAHVFVIVVEEPDLTRRFGETYLAYKRTTNRWLPRISATTARRILAGDALPPDDLHAEDDVAERGPRHHGEGHGLRP